MLCRCTSCRRVSGAPRLPWTTVDSSSLLWTTHAPRERESSPGVFRSFCADCGTPLTWRRADSPGEIDVTSCSFDGDALPQQPASEIWTDDDLDDIEHAEGLPRYRRSASNHWLAPAPAGIEIREVGYASHTRELMQVRVAVFVEEQGVPLDIEADDRDAHCLHLLATREGVPVGTGRLDVERRKIGRVAIARELRSKGLGRDLMRNLHRLARRSGLDDVWCNAQQSAVPFYERLGYRAEGAPFEEAGIPHRRMQAELAVLAS
ncbi:MAG: GNAT family N-acetyltransferase [Steroidobacteraceae bacterium]